MATDNIKLPLVHSISYAYNTKGIIGAAKVLFAHKKTSITIGDAKRYIDTHKNSLATSKIKLSLQKMNTSILKKPTSNIVVLTDNSKDNNTTKDNQKNNSLNTDKPTEAISFFEQELTKLENKIQQLNIPETHLNGCREYAKHLTDSYPAEKHKILTMGRQCLLINASLNADLGTSDFKNHIIPRPISGLKMAMDRCIPATGEVNTEKLNNIFKVIIPEKDTLDNKTLVISRNLCLIETMDLIKPYLESYLNEKEIPYHFDFAISTTPTSEYVDTDMAHTTTEHYYEKVKSLENSPHVTVWKRPSEEINADSEWFDSITELNLDYYRKKNMPDLLKGNSNFSYNHDNEALLRYIQKRNIERPSSNN